MPQGFDKTKPEYQSGLSSEMYRIQFNALCSHHEGPSEPHDLQPGMIWIDTSDDNNWKLKLRNDSNWTILLYNVKYSPVALAAYMEHEQVTPVAQWTITHNHGRRVMPVIVVNDSFVTINPATYTIEYLNENQLNINFPGPITGKAYVF
jgi:hypothetical protein